MTDPSLHSVLERLVRSGDLAADDLQVVAPGVVAVRSGRRDTGSAVLYDAHPFEHVRDPGGIHVFTSGLSPLARRTLDSIRPDAMVLEIGSGPGHFTALVRQRTACVVALDQSVESLRRLRRSVDAAAVAADAESLPFADETFDVVLADGVLHHAAHSGAAFREAVRVVAPGGSLFVRMYQAEGRYPVVYRTVGTLMRAVHRDPWMRRAVWGYAASAYRQLAERRDRLRGRPPGCHDEGVFSDYFLTPHATPITGPRLLRWVRAAGFEVVEYEAWGNVHGILARRLGGSPTG